MTQRRGGHPPDGVPLRRAVGVIRRGLLRDVPGGGGGPSAAEGVAWWTGGQEEGEEEGEGAVEGCGSGLVG